MIPMVMIFSGLLFSYSIAIYSNYKVLQYIKRSHMIEPLKTDYKNLQFAMIVQSMAQTIMLFIPTGLLWLSIILQYEGSIIYAMIIELTPAVTSISTMLSIPEFRILVKKKYNLLLDLIKL